MIILGLDPGIGRTGFGVLDTAKNNPFLCCGCLTTPAHQNTPDRLHTLGQNLASLIKKTKPNQAAVEDIFFGNNAKTAMLTAQARGTLLYILRQHHILVRSFTPLQIKSRLVGYGQASKQQIQTTVTTRLNLAAIPQPDDAADALAIALCLVDEAPLHIATVYDSLGGP